MEISPLIQNGTRWKCWTYLERRPVWATIGAIVGGLSIIIAAMIYRSQNSSKAISEVQDSVCNTPACVLAAAELLKNMDKNVDPCEDFYSFACGGFEAKMAIPDHQPKVDTFSLNRDRVTQQLRFLIEKSIKENDAYEPFRLVTKLYQSCLDKTRLEELGLEPLKKILEQFGGWPVLEGDKWNETNFVWYQTIYKFRRAGYPIDYLFDLSVVTDMKNSSSHIIQLDQLNVKNLKKSLVSDYFSNKFFEDLLEHRIGLAILLGANEESARVQYTQALELELKLIQIRVSDEERRDLKKLYNPMTIEELSDQIPSVPWLEYINTMLAPHHVLTKDEIINVAVPDYFSKLIDLLAKTPKRSSGNRRILANYLMWKVPQYSAKYLNEAARNLDLKFGVPLAGTTEYEPRSKECMDFVSEKLGFAISAMYVRKYFDDDIRPSIKEMVDDIRSVFIEMIDEADWLDSKTRMHAKKKATAIKTHIAYPDELLNLKKLTDYYEELTLNSNDYFNNVLNLSKFNVNNNLKKLREPVNNIDSTSYESYSTNVNAFYLPNQNSIQIPAGILQSPFFGKDRPAYLNFAAIGWIIGHEITHGFDVETSQFGPEGNLVDWWEAQAPVKKNYMERAQCIINQYGNYTVPQLGMNLNGANTREENIADNGGMKEAYRAYIKWASRQKAFSGNWDQVEQRLPGLGEYNIRQLFWLGAASSWCEKLRPEDLLIKIFIGIHSPLRFRVLGTFANMPEFASDYNCSVGSPMNPEMKCTIW